MQKQTDYLEAIKTKYPEQVIIAIAKDPTGRPNPITLGWAMTVSFEPPMWAIAVSEIHYTPSCIRHSKCFTIALPSADQKDAAMFFGSRSGRDIDKFAACPRHCATEPAKKIDSVLLCEAVANFECTLEKEYPAGDHIIFIGKVVSSTINTDPNRRLYTLGPGHKLGAVSAR
ncbi:MAG: hypothetical protein A2Y07_08010 [Planctomycetes bacterium GWF2_50_10]|nr:MAG: hypothetical protein A2Y07_08010 [Planctomycetes bacterium GWF2_50_10]